MTNNEIRIRLRLMRAGVKPRDIARHLGVTEQAVSQVIKGSCRSANIERVLTHPREVLLAKPTPRRRHAA